MLGSTQRLLAERIEVAPAIGVSLDGGVLSDAKAAKLAAEDDAAHRCSASGRCG